MMCAGYAKFALTQEGGPDLSQTGGGRMGRDHHNIWL